MKRILTALLACVIVAALASCSGDNVSWSFDKNTGELVISGSGYMQNYDRDNMPPWSDYSDQIRNVTIEPGVRSIGEWAFQDCISLTDIAIPDSVTRIENLAFYYCKSLASITIPDSVKRIEDQAFCLCESLTSITIPDSVTSIGDKAFYSCGNLTEILVDTENAKYMSDSGILYNKKQTEVIAFPAGNGLAHFSIPDSVTSIGRGAFSHCNNLTSIAISKNVTSIKEDAFVYCDNLAEITVDEDNQKYRSDEGILYNKDQTEIIACPIGKGFMHFTIPDSVTKIGEDAFSSCDSLTSITIPDGVTSIGDQAFFLCENLTSITIPYSVTSIRAWTFEGCDNLTILCYPGSFAEGHAVDNDIPYDYID